MHEKLAPNIIRDIHLQIGRNVAKCRKEKGFSQLDLSTELGYKSTSPIAMAEINYKGTHFNIENLVNLSSCLEVDIEYFLKDINPIILKNKTGV